MRFKYHLISLMIFFLILSPFVKKSLAAEEDERDKGNLSIRIEAGPLWVNTTSQLYPNDKNERNATLIDDADNYDLLIPLVLFDIRYKLQDNGTEIYAGTPLKDDSLSLAFGVVFPFKYESSLDVSYFTTPFSDVWEDPYITGTDRVETDVSSGGYYIKFNKMGGSDITLSYSFKNTDVDRDVIGSAYSDLKRDGVTEEIDLAYTFNLESGNVLIPKISYSAADIDGASNSYNGYALKLNYLRIRTEKDYILSVFLSAGKNAYDKLHPLFNKKRDEKKYNLLAVFTLLEPFGLKDYFCNFVAGYFKTDSDISFFDSRTTLSAVTFGYQF